VTPEEREAYDQGYEDGIWWCSRWIVVLIAAVVCAGIVLSFAHAQAADVRYHIRLHVFFDDGLKFIEYDETYADEAACYRRGDALAAQYVRQRIMAVAYCEPVHQILDLGKTYT
jgi:hypothetical protein